MRYFAHQVSISFSLLCFFVFSIVFVLQSCSTTPEPSQGLDDQQVNFPADIALAAYSLNSIVHPGSNNLVINRALQCAFAASNSENVSSKDDRLIQVEIDKAGPIRSKDAVEALHLIKSRLFFRDVNKSVLAVAKLVPSMPERLIRDSLRIVGKLGRKPNTDALKNPISLRNILSRIYKGESTAEIADTASTMLEIESVQLAIVVYARANGINIEKNDLEALQKTLSNSKNPDLGPLLRQGKQRLAEEMGANQAVEVLKSMQVGSNGCGAG